MFRENSPVKFVAEISDESLDGLPCAQITGSLSNEFSSPVGETTRLDGKSRKPQDEKEFSSKNPNLSLQKQDSEQGDPFDLTSQGQSKNNMNFFLIYKRN